MTNLTTALNLAVRARAAAHRLTGLAMSDDPFGFVRIGQAEALFGLVNDFVGDVFKEHCDRETGCPEDALVPCRVRQGGFATLVEYVFVNLHEVVGIVSEVKSGEDLDQFLHDWDCDIRVILYDIVEGLRMESPGSRRLERLAAAIENDQPSALEERGGV